MDIINLKELDKRNLYQVKRQSEVYRFDQKNLMHIFKTNDLKALGNKRKKIELFKELEDDLNIKITGIVEKDGITRGYVLEENKEFVPFPTDDFKKKKMKTLSELKRYLELLHSKGIIYGNITFQNVEKSSTKQTVRINNIDDIYINGYGFDEPSSEMSRYINHFDVDKVLDIYMFNIFTISYITRVPIDIIFFYLKTNRLPFFLDSKKNRKLLDEMHYLDSKEALNETIIENAKRYHI